MFEDLLQKVIDGYTEIKLEGMLGHPVFLRHFKPQDQLYIQRRFDELLEIYKKEGLLTSQDRINEMMRDGLWEKKKEDELGSIKEHIKQIKLQLTSPQLMDRGHWENEVLRLTKDAEKILIERKQVMGKTVEDFTEDALHADLVHRVLYLNKDCTEHAYSIEDVEYMDQGLMAFLAVTIQQEINNISDTQLAKLACMPITQQIVGVCGNIVDFYGKPAIDLTYPQIELYSLTKLYQPYFESNPPKETWGDPEALMKHFQGQRSQQDAEARKANDQSLRQKFRQLKTEEAKRKV